MPIRILHGLILLAFAVWPNHASAQARLVKEFVTELIGVVARSASKENAIAVAKTIGKGAGEETGKALVTGTAVAIGVAISSKVSGQAESSPGIVIKREPQAPEPSAPVGATAVKTNSIGAVNFQALPPAIQYSKYRLIKLKGQKWTRYTASKFCLLSNQGNQTTCEPCRLDESERTCEPTTESKIAVHCDDDVNCIPQREYENASALRQTRCDRSRDRDFDTERAYVVGSLMSTNKSLWIKLWKFPDPTIRATAQVANGTKVKRLTEIRLRGVNFICIGLVENWGKERIYGFVEDIDFQMGNKFEQFFQ